MNLENETIMGLDLSFHSTGWAVTKGMKPLASGLVIPDKDWKKTTFNSLEFPNFLEWYKEKIRVLVKQLHQEYKFKHVAIESLNIEHISILKVLMQIQAAAKIGIVEGCDELKIIPVHNLSVKSFLGLPHRKVDIPPSIALLAKKLKKKPIKIMIIDKVNELYHLQFSYDDDDRADAICMCWVGLKKLGDGSVQF